jgi:peptidoglycan glycosyltransferase
MGKDLNTNEMMQVCIGQDKTQVSPLQINLVTAAIANGGVMMQPYVIERVVTADGRTIRRFEPREYGTVMSGEESAILTELMIGVVDHGTGKRINDLPFTVAGKTGSAEFSAIKTQSHAWFTGFAPAEDPQIAVTVIVENAGSGGEVAAPIAGDVFSAYFSR